jgi:transposase
MLSLSAPSEGRTASHYKLAAAVRLFPRLFPTAGHLASWAGLCPGNNESAGKRKSGKSRKGDCWLRATLVECARGAVRARYSYLAAQYHRLARRRGDKKAIVAVGHSILVAA